MARAIAGGLDGQPIGGVGEQPILDAHDREFARPVHEIAPRIVELAEPAHDRHDGSDLDAPLDGQPAADAQRHGDRQVMHQVHQEVHRVLELVDAHVEGEDALDRLAAQAAAVVLRKRALDDRAADAALGENARLGAAVDRPLQERNEHHLGNEEGEAKQSQPGLEIDHVADHARQDAALQQRLGDADADEAADRLGLLQDHGDLHARPAVRMGPRVRRDALAAHAVAQPADGVFGHPAAIDVEDQLEGLLGERHAPRRRPPARRSSGTCPCRSRR